MLRLWCNHGCEWVNQHHHCRDLTTVSIVSQDIYDNIRAEALRDACERARKWMLDPEPGFSLLTAILAGEVKE